mmetsp:Transcript_3232/g.11277  ORF Transcript_3232/g.11277 Transcript_3232/m.11277 type:complete len:528 (-) Transcript_3232:112-1695(-)
MGDAVQLVRGEVGLLVLDVVAALLLRLEGRDVDVGRGANRLLLSLCAAGNDEFAVGTAVEREGCPELLVLELSLALVHDDHAHSRVPLDPPLHAKVQRLAALHLVALHAVPLEDRVAVLQHEHVAAVQALWHRVDAADADAVAALDLVEDLVEEVGSLGLAQLHGLHVLNRLVEVRAEVLALFLLCLVRDGHHVLQRQAQLQLCHPLVALRAHLVRAVVADPGVDVVVAAAARDGCVEDDVGLAGVEGAVALANESAEAVLELGDLGDLLVAEDPDFEAGLLAKVREEADAVDDLVAEAELLHLLLVPLPPLLLLGHHCLHLLLPPRLLLLERRRPLCLQPLPLLLLHVPLCLLLLAHLLRVPLHRETVLLLHRLQLGLGLCPLLCLARLLLCLLPGQLLQPLALLLLALLLQPCELLLLLPLLLLLCLLLLFHICCLSVTALAPSCVRGGLLSLRILLATSVLLHNDSDIVHLLLCLRDICLLVLRFLGQREREIERALHTLCLGCPPLLFGGREISLAHGRRIDG